MKHLIFAFLTVFTLFFGIQNSYSQTLNYGDDIHLQNGFNNYSGGFLDTKGSQAEFEKTGNLYCVSTATDKKRDGGSSGTWKVQIINEAAIGKQQVWTTVNTNVDKFTNVDPIQMPNLKEVTIGKQVWMTENLNVDKFSNGDQIPHAKTAEEWVKAGVDKQPAWCYYDNDAAKGAQYGKLYNWYAVKDPRGLAPLGCYIPNIDEWRQLLDYLGGNKVASGKMKSASGWMEGSNGTNESGFSGLQGGIRDHLDGQFYGATGTWWSSMERDADKAFQLSLKILDGESLLQYDFKEVGASVRCLVGTPARRVTNPATGKIWMDRNLGATQVAKSSTDAASYGDLYQWGRGADGHQKRTAVTTTILSATDKPGNGNFSLGHNTPHDWLSPQNTNLWQGVNGINNPCPNGYRLPTDAELNAERESWRTKDPAGAFASPLKLPMAGFRGFSSGYLEQVGVYGRYWSSTVSNIQSRNLHFSSGDVNMYPGNRAFGYSVRCIKD